MSELTQDTLKKFLHYDPETGIFTRLINLAPGGKAGGVAGAVNNRGYRHMAILKRSYYAHRLAWLYVYGEWPKGQIDHIDGNQVNNAIANLRDATPVQNRANSPAAKNNPLGLKGVSFEHGKYRARIGIGEKKISLGSFETAEQAAAAYVGAAIILHGEFARCAA